MATFGERPTPGSIWEVRVVTSTFLHHQLSLITSLLEAFPPCRSACPSSACCPSRFFPAPSGRVGVRPLTPVVFQASLPCWQQPSRCTPMLPVPVAPRGLRPLSFRAEPGASRPLCSPGHGCDWLWGLCSPPPGPSVPLTTPSVLELSRPGGFPPLLPPSPLVGDFTLS